MFVPAMAANEARFRLMRGKGKKFYISKRFHHLGTGNGTLQCGRSLTQNVNGKAIWVGSCFMCDGYSKLWASSDVELAKQLKPYERYYYAGIARNDELKPQIVVCPKSLHEFIVRSIIGDFEKTIRPLGDITNLANGRDLVIVKEVVAGPDGQRWPDYKKSYFENPSPAGTKSQIEAWEKMLPNLAELDWTPDEEKVRKVMDMCFGLKFPRTRKRARYRSIDDPSETV